MSFTFEKKDDILKVTIHDKRATVDLTAKFKEELIAKIESGDAKVLVDLSNVEYVDSSFLGALIAGLKTATLKNGDLKIVSLQPPVKEMFDLTRLYRIFDIYDSIDDALKTF